MTEPEPVSQPEPASPPESRDALTVCVIGAGPRGLSVLERLRANASQARGPVVVHLVDPYPPGPGAVWRTDQPAELLMNTVASQVTLFTDDSVPCAGPAVPGPSLYEWALTLGPEAYPARVLAEARRLGPDTYPTRAFHGHYLEWVFQHLMHTAPPEFTVHTHRTTATELADAPDSTQTVTLADGARLTGLDAVVLALGHGQSTPTGEERELRSFAARHAPNRAGSGVTYVGPANPADADLSALRPGTPVALRGLGLNFFDQLALLTEGRGGTFKQTHQGSQGGGLVYIPSGNEPLLYAGSRRGVPYHARGENEKGALGRHHPRFLTPEVIAGLRRRPVGFRADIWPLIDREVRTVYYEAWIRAAQGPWAAAEFVRCCFAGRDPEPVLLDRYEVPPDERWDWRRIERPYGDRHFTSRADFRRWLLGYLRRDVAAARLGNVNGPLKAALDALRDLRNEVRLVVDHGGVVGESYRAELDGWYTPLNAFTSIGPPAFRIEQLIALIEAEVLHVVGPGMRIRPTSDAGGPGEAGFLVDAEGVSQAPVPVRALVEARLPDIDLRRSASPLLRGLLAEGGCVPYRPGGHEARETHEADGPHETGGMAVTGGAPRLLDASGRPHPRRFAFGVPTEGVRWVTAVGIRPGVGSVTLEDSDAIARAVLGLEGAVESQESVESRGSRLTGLAGERRTPLVKAELLAPQTSGAGSR
ncbi:FAD/NAD(P)-binding protein [Streptomyces sp. WI04-05B]|uniref:FAD/NAD(P)-binding protein n=1 Tax=Streptomyces TaxID=1883 RepID=UPI0029A085B1|nr:MULTISPECIES: FAD/NAD(P)-binding protein [unclassified Streptomyces]MDX2543116.1 FAD/NAD(P)-binding protein [Streptomyces sp. WI04-05B]MDX2584843.1 FAD/NAD(P)-binding protein [Streptomyces sp. WI04-05A]